jgi:hypothetical protein
MTTFSRWMKAALLAGGASLVLGGCTVSAATPRMRVAYQTDPVYPEPVYQPGPVYPEPAYQTRPVLFDGLVVHYDSVGPYIFVGTTPRYIPRNHPRYREVARNEPRYERRPDRRYEPRGGHYGRRNDGRSDRRGPRHY